jgi:cytochrome c
VPVARLPVFSLALCYATLLLLACNSGTAKPQPAPPSRIQDQSSVIPLDGARIFRNYCASCHGVNGNGDCPVAPALKTKVPQLTTLAQRNGGMFPADRVRSIIAGDGVFRRPWFTGDAHLGSDLSPNRIRSGLGLRPASECDGISQYYPAKVASEAKAP